MENVTTTRWSWLACTVAALALASASCSSSDTAPGDARATRTVRTPADSRAPGAAELDLRAMLTPVPDYDGQGRNLFDYGPVRRPATAANTNRPGNVNRPQAPPPPAPRPAPTRPSGGRITAKYAGFVEKTEASGAKAKYAIFLDGNEILAGAEGETIANRFTVVEIGLESVTISAAGTNSTQRIPLQAN